MRACWESDQPEFHGEVYDFEGFHFAPRPYQNRRLPVLIGGASTAAFRRAARFGDGWIGDGQTFDELEVALSQLSRQLAERDLELLERLPIADPAVSETRRPAKGGSRRPADQDGQPAILIRPRRKVKSLEVIDLTVELSLPPDS
jgi:alkanesulfonate monooxygenase SsuD/methylene tetrahydromethanopterin reductase-like flavin-dependent oxidoreductase (luciferase family)